MPPGPHHQIANLRRSPGELSFEAQVGDRTQALWMRSETDVIPAPEAALAACLMPAMRTGGTLEMTDPVSPRVLRAQREFQAIQVAWSLRWEFGEPPLREVEVVAPVRAPDPTPDEGRVAAFFSGGVDSWSTVLDNPDLTDLIFVRGFDLIPGAAHQLELGFEVEARLREAADAIGLQLHVVDTNLRELSDPLVRWDSCYGGALVAVAHFFAPLFERVLIATANDYEVQPEFGANWMVDRLWSSERLEIADDGGRYSRMERVARIAAHPVVRQTLRVCWQNPGGAYNCGSCRKCLTTMTALETLGMRRQVETFPAELNLEAVAAVELTQPLLNFWEDLLDAARAAGRPDLERAVGMAVARAKAAFGLPADYRQRRTPGPPTTIRFAAIVPVWRQARYLAGAVQSALDQEVATGVVIVNDGCPDPDTDRIGQALRDADPDRVAYLRQPNSGVAAARNAGIRRALARWPQVEAIFPLDSDNLLSPQTLAKLAATLDENPKASWATPALELFGAEEAVWQIPGPYLPYRQLFTNQCDTGSLIRRAIFEAGIEYDETMRYGFEDWELFLHATLAGHRGVMAGPCGFRYRRRPESMLKGALQRAEHLEAEIRERHPDAYEPGTLSRREHAEAPRFALVRCDRRDVLLTARCDLEPQRQTLAEFARSLVTLGDAGRRATTHVPPVIVFTTAAALDRFGTVDLATALFKLQAALRDGATAGLRLGADADAPAAVAIRASALIHLPKEIPPYPQTIVEFEPAIAGASCPLPDPASSAALTLLVTAAEEGGWPLPDNSHSMFLEYHHLNRWETTFPWSEGGAARAEAEKAA